jgi:hypothetical protein
MGFAGFAPGKVQGGDRGGQLWVNVPVEVPGA